MANRKKITSKHMAVREQIKERISLFFFYYIVLPILGVWFGRYIHKIRKRGEFGRH